MENYYEIISCFDVKDNNLDVDMTRLNEVMKKYKIEYNNNKKFLLYIERELNKQIKTNKELLNEIRNKAKKIY